jgi:hypothetical protein
MGFDMEWPSSFRLTRADDHVVIDVKTTGLVVKPAPNGPRGAFVLQPEPGSSGTIELSLPPQQLLEYASDSQGNRVDQAQPIFTDPSVLVLHVGSGVAPIPATVAGILDAARRLPVVTATSQVELPHLLRLEPDGGWTPLRHPATPAATNGHVELWSSTLVDRLDAVDGGGGRPVRVTRLSQDVNQAGTGDDAWVTAVLDEGKLRNTLDRATAQALQVRTDDEPAALRCLRVSSLGGWLDLRGEWLDTPGLQTFSHLTSMGRDEAQRKDGTGRLFPFNFRAKLSSETLRRLDGDLEPLERTAGLRKLDTIRVTGPVVTMEAKARALPFTRLEMLIATTPPGDAIEPPEVDGHEVLVDKGLAVLHVGGTPYRFAIEATDHAGKTFLVSMPLLFVPDGTEEDASGNHFNLPDEAVMPLWRELSADFRDIAVDGQAVAVAPPVTSASAVERSNGALPAPDATTMRLKRLVLAPTQELTQINGAATLIGPLASRLEGVLPTVDRFAPGGATAIATYADTYIQQAFNDANAQAGVFLALAEERAVGVGSAVTGGLASLGLPVTALSRERGAVVGAVENLLAGKADLSFLDDAPDLLGVIPMTKLIPVGPGIERLLDEAAEITSEVVDGVVTKKIRWNADLFDPNDPNATVGADDGEDAGFFVVAPFRPTLQDPKPSITIEQTITLDASGKQLDTHSRCDVVGFELRLLATKNGTPLVTVPFRKFTFSAAPGEKPDVDVLMGRLRFGGFLSYLGRLVDLIDDAGFNDPPALEVTDTGIKSSFTFPIPTVAIGMFALQNISFGAELTIDFEGAKPTLAVRFARAADRFRLTVAALAGGGYLEIELDTGGIKRVEGTLEFGAAAALDVLVAVVSVEAMGGVLISYDRSNGLVFVAYLRLRGHVEVASLISADISLTLTLTYADATNTLIGHGELVLELKVLFVSESLRVPVTRKFAGQNADPTFAELMAPADFPSRRPWDDYCDAFMEVA